MLIHFEIHNDIGESIYTINYDVRLNIGLSQRPRTLVVENTCKTYHAVEDFSIRIIFVVVSLGL